MIEMLSKGSESDVMLCDAYGRTALAYAAAGDHVACAAALIERGCDVNAADKVDVLPALKACNSRERQERVAEVS